MKRIPCSLPNGVGSRHAARYCFLAGLTGLLAPGCGAPPPSSSTIEGNGEAITGGTLIPSNVVPYSSVVFWNNNCTATKIGNRRFLTASHCIKTLAAGNPFSVTNALDATTATPMNLTVANVFVHPSNPNVILNPNADPAEPEGPMSYDAALIDVTSDTPTITTQPVNSIPFGDGFGGTTIGYGCNNANPTKDAQKRLGGFTAMTLAAIQTATGQSAEHVLDVYSHDVVFDFALRGRQVCPGDSGGPTIRNSNLAVAGITSVFQGSGTAASCLNQACLSYVVRTANIRRWIASPQTNVFQNGSGGFFLNALSAKCITSGDPSVVDPNLPGVTFAFSGICSAPNQETDLQFWTLQTQSPGFFSIVNGNSGRCFASVFSSGATDVCNGFDTQAWKFTRVTSSSPAYYKIENKAVPGICVETITPGNGGDLAMKPCVDKPGQRWIFTE